MFFLQRGGRSFFPSASASGNAPLSEDSVCSDRCHFFKKDRGSPLDIARVSVWYSCARGLIPVSLFIVHEPNSDKNTRPPLSPHTQDPADPKAMKWEPPQALVLGSSVNQQPARKPPAALESFLATGILEGPTALRLGLLLQGLQLVKGGMVPRSVLPTQGQSLISQPLNVSNTCAT